MSHRVVLFTSPSCSLCEAARAILDETGHPYVEASDDRYVLRVPVVEVDGAIVAEGQVSARAVRRALRPRWFRRARGPRDSL